jgi:hypothetical protein
MNEKRETMNVSQLNTTHKVVKMVVSDECLKYKSVMQNCKSQCIKSQSKNYTNNNGLIQSKLRKPTVPVIQQTNTSENPSKT